MAIFALSFTAVAQQCPNISGLSNDETICETENLYISSNIQHDSVINWISDGDGSFSNGSTEDPTYIPGDDDIASGSVILTVNVTPYSDCPDYPNPVTEDVLLTIIKEPQPDAGSGGTVCAGDAILISDASIDGDYSSFSWNEDGDGSLTGTNTLSPTYEAAASE
ncbi:MAG: hypothetical protein K9I47_06835, partial [Bacteroidales bacterium]|nr:hypothetical protein [Bacteroidales bacterium]